MQTFASTALLGVIALVAVSSVAVADDWSGNDFDGGGHGVWVGDGGGKGWALKGSGASWARGGG